MTAVFHLGIVIQRSFCQSSITCRLTWQPQRSKTRCKCVEVFLPFFTCKNLGFSPNFRLNQFWDWQVNGFIHISQHSSTNHGNATNTAGDFMTKFVAIFGMNPPIHSLWMVQGNNQRTSLILKTLTGLNHGFLASSFFQLSWLRRLPSLVLQTIPILHQVTKSHSSPEIKPLMNPNFWLPAEGFHWVFPASPFPGVI